MTGIRIRVRTPSRLHFGLLGWGPHVRRQFGGVGLMIDPPGIELIAEPATAWIAEGPLAVRVQSLLGQLRERIAETGATLPPVRIRVVSAPPEHVGFGVGTQLCLAVARAVFKLAGVAEPAIDELARLTGRGHRSGIGLYGFQHGGLIIDGGGTQETGIPPLLARVPFPENWSILIVQPPGPSGLHGQAEVRAFADLPPIARDITDTLCRLVLLEMLPAVIEHDLPAFGAGLTELQARVGRMLHAGPRRHLHHAAGGGNRQRIGAPGLRRRRPEFVGTDSLRLCRSCRRPDRRVNGKSPPAIRAR